MRVSKGPARADDKSVFSVSEKPLSNLHKPVSFMPSGSLVAGFSSRTLPGGQVSREVIFWERNGLRHGEFPMPDKQGLVVKNLEFSLDSALLALHCFAPDSSELVYIMYRSNWKWFCKQAIHLDKPLANFKWMFNKKQQLFLI
jgi:elongator complex protein 1